MLSLSGTVDYLNPAALKLSGMDSADAILGRPWVTFWPEEARPALEAAMDSARRGETKTFRAARRTATGSRQWLESTVSPMRNDAGEIIQIGRASCRESV